MCPDATIDCWGYSSHLYYDSPSGGSFTAVSTGTYKAVAAGHSHSCALRSDYTVTCWGEVATDLQGSNDT